LPISIETFESIDEPAIMPLKLGEGEYKREMILMSSPKRAALNPSK